LIVFSLPWVLPFPGLGCQGVFKKKTQLWGQNSPENCWGRGETRVSLEGERALPSAVRAQLEAVEAVEAQHPRPPTHVHRPMRTGAFARAMALEHTLAAARDRHTKGLRFLSLTFRFSTFSFQINKYQARKYEARWAKVVPTKLLPTSVEIHKTGFSTPAITSFQFTQIMDRTYHSCWCNIMVEHGLISCRPPAALRVPVRLVVDQHGRGQVLLDVQHRHALYAAHFRQRHSCSPVQEYGEAYSQHH
jgi:hypothetical protein